MSLIFADGFEGYTSAEIPNYWTDDKIIFSSTIVSSPTHYGTQAMQPSAFGVQKSIAAVQSFILGFAVLPAYNQELIVLKTISTATGTNTIGRLRWTTNGKIQIERSIGGTSTLATTSPKFAMNNGNLPTRFYYIEWTTGITNASLNEIRIDGNLALSTTLDFVGTNVTISNVNAVEFFGNGNIFDDVYMCSQDGLGVHTPIGEVGIPSLFPTADGSFSGWTPNSGTVHFNRVNEKPADNDTTYNSATGAAVIDTYKVSTAVVNNTDVVPAAQLIQLTRDDGTTGTLTLRPFIVVNGGTFGTSAQNFTPAGSYIPAHTQIYEQEPVGVVAWTGTTINQTEWGIDKV